MVLNLPVLLRRVRPPAQLLETCPPFLQGFRDRTVAWSGRLVRLLSPLLLLAPAARRRPPARRLSVHSLPFSPTPLLLPPSPSRSRHPPPLRAPSSAQVVRYLPEPLVEFSLVPGIFVGVALVQLWEGRGGAGGGALELARLSSGVTLVAASVVLSALLTKLTSGSSASLGALGRKLRLSFPAQSVAMTLHERLAESGSDEETLRIVVEVLHGVVPSAVALARAPARPPSLLPRRRPRAARSPAVAACVCIRHPLADGCA